MLDPLSKEPIDEDADHVEFEVAVIAEALEALRGNFTKLGDGISESRNLLSLLFPILSRAIERIDCSSQHKMLCLELLGDYARKSCKPMRSVAAAVRCLTRAINYSVSPKFTLLAQDTLLSVGKTSTNARCAGVSIWCENESSVLRKTCLEALSSLSNIHDTVEDIETTDEILRDIAVRLFTLNMIQTKRSLKWHRLMQMRAYLLPLKAIPNRRLFYSRFSRTSVSQFEKRR